MEVSGQQQVQISQQNFGFRREELSNRYNLLERSVTYEDLQKEIQFGVPKHSELEPGLSAG